jgi:hypothetical protein
MFSRISHSNGLATIGRIQTGGDRIGKRASPAISATHPTYLTSLTAITSISSSNPGLASAAMATVFSGEHP